MAAVPCSNDNSTNYSRWICLSWLCLWSVFVELANGVFSFGEKYQRNSDQETLTSSKLFQFAIREQMFSDERGEREEKIGTNSRTPNAEATRMPFRPPSVWVDPPNEIRQTKMLGRMLYGVCISLRGVHRFARVRFIRNSVGSASEHQVNNVQLDKWSNRGNNHIHACTPKRPSASVRACVCCCCCLSDEWVGRGQKETDTLNPQAAITLSTSCYSILRFVQANLAVCAVCDGSPLLPAADDNHDMHDVLTRVLRTHWLREFSSVSITHQIFRLCTMGKSSIRGNVATADAIEYRCLDFLPTALFVSLFVLLLALLRIAHVTDRSQREILSTVLWLGRSICVWVHWHIATEFQPKPELPPQSDRHSTIIFLFNCNICQSEPSERTDKRNPNNEEPNPKVIRMSHGYCGNIHENRRIAMRARFYLFFPTLWFHFQAIP